MIQSEKIKLGVVLGNRGFFPGELCVEARKLIYQALEERGFEPVGAAESDLQYGAVSDFKDAEKSIGYFQDHAIDGLLISLPNFGDESSLVEVAKRAAKNVPILVQAFPDQLAKLEVGQRRDAYCGKISLCNNLAQAGIPYNLTSSHVVHPSSEEFSADLDDFLRVCRIVKQMRANRLGQIGVRPDAFRTVRYSEKILERFNQSVFQISLDRMVALATGLDATDPALQEMRDQLSGILVSRDASESDQIHDALDRLARLGAAIQIWIKDLSLDAIAFQCWTNLQETYGVVPCAVLGILGQMGIPGACEADILGALSMLVLQAASGSPAALIDWNNNYDLEPDRAIVFHCSNFPPSMMTYSGNEPLMEEHPVLRNSLGGDRTFGSLSGTLRPGKMTFLRLSTIDTRGTLEGYTGAGEILENRLNTFGGTGVIEVPHLEGLLKHICLNGFEHHAAIGEGDLSGVIAPTLEKYLGWQVYQHT